MLSTNPSSSSSESTATSWVESVSSTISSFFSVNAEEVEDAPESAEAKEEEEEEPEDVKPQLDEACAETQACQPFKAHLEKCSERVNSGQSPHEDCVEELFHLMHCVDNCAVPKLFAQLK